MRPNLDRILPLFAPLLRRTLRSGQAAREAQFAIMPRNPGRAVFLGDSITEWTAWEEWFPGHATLNRGIGGQAVRDVHARLGTALVAPRAVSLMIGTNDLHGLGASTDVTAIAVQLGGLIRAIRVMAPDALLVVNSVTPRSAWFADRIIALNADARRLAAENGAAFCDLWPTFAGPDRAIRPELTTDGLHLSLAGYALWADLLRPHLASFARGN